MTAADRRIAREPGEGRTLALGPNLLTWKAIGADTDGRYALMEFVTMPGTRPVGTSIITRTSRSMSSKARSRSISTTRSCVRSPAHTF